MRTRLMVPPVLVAVAAAGLVVSGERRVGAAGDAKTTVTIKAARGTDLSGDRLQPQAASGARTDVTSWCSSRRAQLSAAATTTKFASDDASLSGGIYRWSTGTPGPPGAVLRHRPAHPRLQGRQQPDHPARCGTPDSDPPRIDRGALRRSDVALEDRRLGEAGQPLADAAGPQLADAVDGLEVVDAGGEQLLQGAEVLDQPLDDGRGQPRHLGQQPVAARGDGAVEVLAAGRAPGRPRPGRPGRSTTATRARPARPRGPCERRPDGR